MTASYADGLVGITLDGRYRLDAVLGEGGMGSVFRATHVALDRKVAIKLLKPHLTSDQIALERFAREARATHKVDSPHAVKVLDFGVTPLRDYYMVLEYLDGRTVQRELEIDGAFAPARVAHIARQALAALAAAHDQGLVHRDVKPDNLLLMRQGADPDFTKVLDFGVAKLMAADPSLLALTGAGVVFGTPEYMSPEQACGHPLDGRSDLYSLAATMFVMLTGASLFEADSAIGWLTHHARTPPPHLAELRPALAAYPALDGLVQRCLAKHREQRPATAAEMARLIASIEPTLGGATATASPPPAAASPPRTPTRVSSYFPALRDQASAAMVSAAPPVSQAILAAGAPVTAASPDLASQLEGSSISRAPAIRRGRRRWLTGAIVAALLGGAIGLAAQRSSTDPAPASPSPLATSAGVPPVQTATPASPSAPPTGSPIAAIQPPTASPIAAPASAQATQATHPIRPVASAVHPAPTGHTDHSASDAATHLHAAEDAFVSGNRLRQLAEADLALRADPKSIRAKYLLGDALISGGDLDRGCAYLRALAHYGPARERAHAASCPDD